MWLSYAQRPRAAMPRTVTVQTLRTTVRADAWSGLVLLTESAMFATSRGECSSALGRREGKRYMHKVKAP